MYVCNYLTFKKRLQILVALTIKPDNTPIKFYSVHEQTYSIYFASKRKIKKKSRHHYPDG